MLELRVSVTVKLALGLAEEELHPDREGEVLGDSEVVGLCEEERVVERDCVPEELMEGEGVALPVTDRVGLPLGLPEPVRLPD